MTENVPALLIVPFWPAQPWWPDLMKLANRYMILGKGEDVLLAGGRMKKKKKRLPPGKMIAVLSEAKVEKSYSNGFLNKEALQM
jgi:hypothetical protein